MSPEEARATYERQIAQHGENVTLRRGDDLAVDLRARVTGYSREELAAGVDQGARKIIMLAADVEASAWPDAPRQNDEILVRGTSLVIGHVDDSRRRIGGVLIAYEIEAVG